MEVIHALWECGSPGSLLLWGESSRDVRNVEKKRGRPSRAPKARKHPFAIPGPRLAEVLEELSGGPYEVDADSGPLTLLLPSSSKGPVPSPQIIVDEYAGRKTEGLMPWIVHQVRLTPKEGMDLLISLPGEAPGGIAWGDSVGYWRKSAMIALELVARGCFLPELNAFDGKGSREYTASWRTAIPDADLARVRALADAMPPSCYTSLPCVSDGPAASHQSVSNEPATPHQMISDFIGSAVDAFVRDSISYTDLIPTRRGRPPAKEAPLRWWLNALCDGKDKPADPPRGIGALHEKALAWLDIMKPADPEVPLRTCFRLDPPADGRGKKWSLDYFLQSRDDPSLILSAREVWKHTPGTHVFPGLTSGDLQDRLLEDLGRSSKFCPMIEQSLAEMAPAGSKLNVTGAYAFLREYAPLLERCGFGVILPSWYRKPVSRPGVKLKLKPPGGDGVASGLFGREGLVAYDWEIAVGDDTITEEEFMKLAEMKAPLVRVRGQWVEFRPEEVEKAIAFFRNRTGGGEMTLGDALRTGLGPEVSEVGFEVRGVEGEGWVSEVLDRLTGNTRLTQVQKPRTFRGRLRPYQARGLSWLTFLDEFGFGACLADDMGLGKTIQLIALLLHERSGGGKAAGILPTLIVCPMSVVGNWRSELERFAPGLEVMVHHGPDRLSGGRFAKAVKGVDVVITTYSLAGRDEDTLGKVGWRRLVLDEAQNIKNPNARQTRAIMGLGVERRVALTGTPVENRLTELWSIMEFLNPGYLGTLRQFQAGYSIPIERYGDRDRAKDLRRMIGPFVLRRVKSDRSIIRDLPEKTEMKMLCNLTREQGTLYQAVVSDMMEKIGRLEGIKRKGHVFSAMMKLKQICNHPAQFLHDGSTIPGRSGKLLRLEEMLEEALAEGDRALVFTQFREMGGMLRSRLQDTLGREVLFLHGGSTKKAREYMIRRFQEDHDGPPVFVLSLKAGGLGLNLTVANRVFHFDRWWNPAVEGQATDRAYRIGQKKDVLVHKFVTIGTLEERIDLMIEQKKELADGIVGSGEGWITELSTDRLRELFSMDPGAVGGD